MRRAAPFRIKGRQWILRRVVLPTPEGGQAHSLGRSELGTVRLPAQRGRHERTRRGRMTPRNGIRLGSAVLILLLAGCSVGGQPQAAPAPVTPETVTQTV